MDSAKDTQDHQVLIERTGFLSNSPLTDVAVKKIILQAMKQLRSRVQLPKLHAMFQAESIWAVKVVAKEKFDGDLFAAKLKLSQKLTEDHPMTKQSALLLVLNALCI